jgi:hypothetical protein
MNIFYIKVLPFIAYNLVSFSSVGVLSVISFSHVEVILSVIPIQNAV